MSVSQTIVISCAGMGNRLGIGTTKALIDIDGKPLIIRQLEMLSKYKDIRIVVGFQAEKVIDVVTAYRKDITFVFNHNYMNTGTGASLSLAAKYANEYIVSIDGDLIVHPIDLKAVLESDNEVIGCCKPTTDDPVLVTEEIIDNKPMAVKFSRKEGQYEWSGLVKIKTERLQSGTGHVYRLLENVLPMPIKKIRCREIDTMDDYERALAWIKNGYVDNKKSIIGVVGGFDSYATLNVFKSYLNIFDSNNTERPRMIIDNIAIMPNRVRAILYNENKTDIIFSLIDSISDFININADYIIIASNTAQYFLEDIHRELPKSKNVLINILDCCANEIKEHNLSNVCLFVSDTIYKTNIYENTFKKFGIDIVSPQENDRLLINDIISNVKKNNITEKIKTDLKQLILSQNNNIILGCNELSEVYEYIKDDDDIKKHLVFNPLDSVLKYIKRKVY